MRDHTGGGAASDLGERDGAAGSPGKRTLTQALATGRSASAGETSPDAPKEPTSISISSSGASGGGGGNDPFDFNYSPVVGGVKDDSEEEGGRLVGGDATNATTSTTAAATWKDHGEFKWWIKWATDGTSGWIVQKVTNTYSGTKKDGTAITNATVGAHPTYYECWPVSSTGVVTTRAGDARNVDQWERPSMGTGSKGKWSMAGEVYWTSTNPTGSGLKEQGASNAGVLLSGFTAPAGIGSSLLSRSANGAWDSTAAAPTHTGAAK